MRKHCRWHKTEMWDHPELEEVPLLCLPLLPAPLHPNTCHASENRLFIRLTLPLVCEVREGRSSVSLIGRAAWHILSCEWTRQDMWLSVSPPHILSALL